MDRWRTMVVAVGLITVVAACGSGSTAPESSSGVTQSPPAASVTPPVQPTVQPTVEPTVEAALGVPTATVGVPEPTASADDRETPGGGAAANPVSSVRDVDFENGFSYPVYFEDEIEVEVTDGAHESGAREDGSFIGLYVGGVAYGDLNGDGVEEAAVATSLNTGGTGYFDSLHIYGIGDTTAGAGLVRLDTEFFGDRADGGLWHHEIADGRLRTESFLTDQGACCPNMVRLSRFQLGAYDLAPVEQHGPLRWLVVDRHGEGADGTPPEVRFLPGTSAAVLRVVAGDESVSTWFDAAAGQIVDVRPLRGDEVGRMDLVDATGAIVATAADGERLTFELMADGRHELYLTLAGTRSDAPRDSVVLLSIDDRSSAASATDPIDWSSELRQLVVAEDPDVVLTVSKPVFAIGDGGLLNGSIDAWIDRETDWWVADLLEHPPVVRDDTPDLGGSYELQHEITLVGDGLVSVRWDWYEYVCCRPYPNHGQKSLVVDVAAGRIVADDEILDLTRLDQLHELWMQAHEAEHGWRPELFGDRPNWTSLTLVPGGVEFGTDRMGAAGSTATVVSWSALGDLASAEIVDRTTNGTVPSGW